MTNKNRFIVGDKTPEIRLYRTSSIHGKKTFKKGLIAIVKTKHEVNGDSKSLLF